MTQETKEKWNKSWVRRDGEGNLCAWFGQETVYPPENSKVRESTLIVLTERPSAEDGSCFAIYGISAAGNRFPVGNKMEIWMPKSAIEMELRGA